MSIILGMGGQRFFRVGSVRMLRMNAGSWFPRTHCRASGKSDKPWRGSRLHGGAAKQASSTRKDIVTGVEGFNALLLKCSSGRCTREAGQSRSCSSFPCPGDSGLTYCMQAGLRSIDGAKGVAVVAIMGWPSAEHVTRSKRPFCRSKYWSSRILCSRLSIYSRSRCRFLLWLSLSRSRFRFAASDELDTILPDASVEECGRGRVVGVGTIERLIEFYVSRRLTRRTRQSGKPGPLLTGTSPCTEADSLVAVCRRNNQ